ncbi:MAG TPA: hypothetical protein PL033_06815 [Candidatus Brocadiia bacterium]|nr:hypothetical protein [Candidatus Brocadiia bacterium]
MRTEKPDAAASNDNGTPYNGAIFSLRGVLIALGGAVFVAAFCPFNDYRLGNTFFLGNHLPIGVVFVITLLTLVLNPLLAVLAPGKRLGTGDLVLVWAVMTSAATVPSSGLMRYWFNALIVPHHLAQHFITWEPILKYVDPRLFASTNPDSEVIKGFLYGKSEVPWGAWIAPLLRWSVVLLGLAGMFLCLGTVLRRQWVEHESLPFPLAKFMLELVREPETGRTFNSFFRSRAAWVGAAIPIILYIPYGLNAYYPNVPCATLRWNLRPLFLNFPWNTTDAMMQSGQIFPSIAAIGCLLPSDVSFSLWFFMILRNLLLTLAVWAGVPRDADMERMEEFGGYVVLFALLAYVARGHLRRTGRNMIGVITGRGCPEDERAEAWSLFGFFAFAGVVWGWLWTQGMGPVWAFALLGIFLIQNTILARAIAESGLPYLKARFALIHPPLYLFGVRTMGMSATMMFAMLSVLIGYDLRESLLPYATNSNRMACDVRGLRWGRFMAMMAAGVLIAMVVGTCVHLKMDYRYGLPAVDPYATLQCYQEYFNRVVDQQRSPSPAMPAWTHFGIGAGLTALLGVMRVRFPWWPLHPLGFLMSYGSPVRQLWLSFMIGWLVKAGVMRYGGSNAYLKFRPFVYGVIFGECVIAGFWMFATLAVYLSGREPIRITIMPL